MALRDVPLRPKPRDSLNCQDLESPALGTSSLLSFEPKLSLVLPARSSLESDTCFTVKLGFKMKKKSVGGKRTNHQN